MTVLVPNPNSHSKLNFRRYAGFSVLVALCALVGWSASGLIMHLDSNPIWRALNEGYQAMYYAQVGKPGEARVYYVYGSDFSELQRQVELDSDIFSFEKTSLDKVGLVSIDAGSRLAFKRINEMPGIDGVMNIPLMCH